MGLMDVNGLRSKFPWLNAQDQTQGWAYLQFPMKLRPSLSNAARASYSWMTHRFGSWSLPQGSDFWGHETIDSDAAEANTLKTQQLRTVTSWLVAMNGCKASQVLEKTKNDSHHESARDRIQS